MSKNDKHNLYHVLILDKSGSMQSVQKETIDGFNQNLDGMIEDQRDEIKQHVCLVTFSGNVEMPIWKEPLESIKQLDESSYDPDGGTALYDAIGNSITKLKADIGDEIKDEKANVIITIFSDGGENSSGEWQDFNKLKALMDELKDGRMWTFTFMGCDEGSLKTAENLGISRGNILSFSAGSDGTKAAFSQLRSSRQSFTKGLVASLDAQNFSSSIDKLQSLNFFSNSDD